MAHEQDAADDELEFDALGSVLGSLVPGRSRIDRDRVMYRAGQAAAGRPAASGLRSWIAIATILGLVALGEAALLAHRRPPRIVVVHEPAPAPRPVAPAPVRPSASAATPGGFAPGPVEPALGRTDYERLAGQVLRYGLDGLPASPSGAWASPEPWPVPSRELLQEELRKVLDPGGPS